MSNKILAGDAIVPLAMNTNITTAYRKLIMMFDGTPLSKADFEAALYSATSGSGIMEGTTRGQYRVSLLKALAVAKGGTLRAWCNYTTGTVPVHNGPTKIRFPFSERPDEFTKVVGGTVRYFIVAIVASGTVNPDSTTPAHWVGVGTIGDIGSGADLELLGSSINMANVLKANDMFFNYTGE